MMGYKTIAIVVTDETSDAVALRAAISLAQAEEAHLDIFCLGVDPVRYDASPMAAAPVVVHSGAAEAHARAEDLSRWAESVAKDASCTYTVEPVYGTSFGLESTIARTLSYADLTVAAQPYGAGSTPLQISVVEAALFGTGAPVLVVPDTDHDYSARFERPLLAWNESKEALEVLRKALPFLKRSDRTEVVMVDPPSHSPERSDPGGAVCVLLSRHGIKAEVSIVSKTMPRVSDVINRHAQDRSNDLIVMGAYGHSRFREAILGGATRELLETAALPVLMAR